MKRDGFYVAKKLVIPAICGLALLRFDYIVTEACLNWLIFRIVCISTIILLTGLIILLNRSFKGCDVFVVIMTGGLMAMYASELLLHNNYGLSEECFFNVAVTGATVIAVCAVVRFFDIRAKLRDFGVFFRAASIMFFVFYALLLAYALFLRDIQGAFIIRYRAINFVPFATIIRYFRGVGSDFFNNIYGNVLLFVPAGFYTAVFRGRLKLYAGMAAIVVFSVLCETAQYVFALGSADIDDVILNTLGGLAGIVLCILLDVAYRALHKGKGRLFVWGKAAE